MQVLRLKKRDSSGQEKTVGVKVLRSWQDASGKQIYLHTNGVYGYKDGTPVRAKAELDIIGDSIQREMARNWWDIAGSEISKRFYSEKEAADRARAADFQASMTGIDMTQRDQAMYRCRPKKAGPRKKDEWSEPFAWMDKFSSRPDWWGQAESITLSGYEYEMVQVSAAEAAGNLSLDQV